MSRWQDSNLRPPAPKAGAIAGLRYTSKKPQHVKDRYCRAGEIRTREHVLPKHAHIAICGTTRYLQLLFSF